MTDAAVLAAIMLLATLIGLAWDRRARRRARRSFQRAIAPAEQFRRELAALERAAQSRPGERTPWAG
jgi:ABC-type Fe3+ transport system permease subunit